MSFNRFAAGKKVYGQGSYAPTRGTVNPTGYIKRELRKRSVKTKAKGKVDPAVAQLAHREKLRRQLIK